MVQCLFNYCNGTKVQCSEMLLAQNLPNSVSFHALSSAPVKQHEVVMQATTKGRYEHLASIKYLLFLGQDLSCAGFPDDAIQLPGLAASLRHIDLRQQL